MKRFLFLVMLAGCATTGAPRVEDVTATLVCQTATCPDFASRHGYELLLASADGGSCVCRLLSPNGPDSFDVRLP